MLKLIKKANSKNINKKTKTNVDNFKWQKEGINVLKNLNKKYH